MKEALRIHIPSLPVRHSAWRDVPGICGIYVPRERTTTNLDEVTCVACWLARHRRGPFKQAGRR